MTGVANNSLVRSVVSPLAGLAGSRRMVVPNRREQLAEGMTTAEPAAVRRFGSGEAAAGAAGRRGTRTTSGS